MSLVMLAWLSLQDNHMVHSILVVTTRTEKRLCCKVCQVSYYTACNTHMMRRTTHLDKMMLQTIGLPGCFAPQWGHGITLCRPQPTPTISRIANYNNVGLLQSRLNSLRSHWCKYLILCNEQEVGELDKNMIYEPFRHQVWWQVGEN